MIRRIYIPILVMAVIFGGYSLYWQTMSFAKPQSTPVPNLESQKALKRSLKLPERQRKALLKRHLSPLEYYVTQESGTEKAFDNRYWNQKASGLYVDVISGIPLFSSAHKFKSGTGWPSFDRILNIDEVKSRVDQSYGMQRVEVYAHTSNAHLGHLFDDGPTETRMRYCINSASLRFVPIAELKQQGYEEWIENAGLSDAWKALQK